MMRFYPVLAVALLVLCASPKLLAQTPPPAPKNLVINGGFETSSRRENLWQGVDNAGYLTGERGRVSVLALSGAIADTSMSRPTPGQLSRNIIKCGATVNSCLLRPQIGYRGPNPLVHHSGPPDGPESEEPTGSPPDPDRCGFVFVTGSALSVRTALQAVRLGARRPPRRR